ncbi:MAG: hypothetical protein IJJ23_12040 [Clostridia bacterium]|nr:hypothetical protein [Clostridia bacterium]
MNRKSSVSLGPGASSLILIFVVLSMTALGMLSLMTAHNDLKLSLRSAEVVEEVYALSEKAERTKAELTELIYSAAVDDETWSSAIAADLPDSISLEGQVLSWQETDDTRTLDCAVKVTPVDGGFEITWIRHRLTSTIGDGIEGFEDEWN